MPDEQESSQRARPVQEELHTPLRPDNMRQAKIGMATLAACLVETMNDRDSTFRDRFLDRLARTHDNYRNNSDADPLHLLEVIHWTGELLRGWNPVPGRSQSIFGVPPAGADDSGDE